jgi:hypothetical protein
LSRERAHIGRRRRVQRGTKSVPQALEQSQLLRTVLAKKGENTGSTAVDWHFGQTVAGGCLACSAIDWEREKRALHTVQRYS